MFNLEYYEQQDRKQNRMPSKERDVAHNDHAINNPRRNLKTPGSTRMFIIILTAAPSSTIVKATRTILCDEVATFSKSMCEMPQEWKVPSREQVIMYPQEGRATNTQGDKTKLQAALHMRAVN